MGFEQRGDVILYVQGITLSVGAGEGSWLLQGFILSNWRMELPSVGTRKTQWRRLSKWCLEKRSGDGNFELMSVPWTLDTAVAGGDLVWAVHLRVIVTGRCFQPLDWERLTCQWVERQSRRGPTVDPESRGKKRQSQRRDQLTSMGFKRQWRSSVKGWLRTQSRAG
jgi:hypothetical protein